MAVEPDVSSEWPTHDVHEPPAPPTPTFSHIRRSLEQTIEEAEELRPSPNDSPSGSPSPDDGEPDSDEDRIDDEDFRGLGPADTTLFGGPRRGASSFAGRRGDNLLDFIDEVSDGISSYLGFLEERQKGVVYDRHEQAEILRFREYLRSFHAITKERAQADIPPPNSVAEAFSAIDRPCPPPKDVPFEAPQKLQDGKERLSFSACFECGNLALAKSDTPTQYTLLLDFDVNTSGYTQWFYFGVRGGFKGMRVTFKIVNMSKADSHFNRGMRPVLWSEKASRGWERGGSDISYYANEHKRGRCDGESAAHFHTLEFSYTFEHNDDTVFFAYHYPYTYSYLQDLLGWLVAHPYSSRLVRRGTLCRTIGGLACEYIEIGDPDTEPLSPDEPQKPLAVATARVHPGESNSSWMMQGLLQFLCSPTAEAQALRESCTWLVVPMLNPDGVIQGNYRCGLAGADLNRVFSKPHHRLHPTVWHLKERIKHQRVEVYIDLHGHSKKEGVFLYGGHYDNNDRKNAEDSKLTTARLVAFLQLGILNAYTVEASFANGGPNETEDGDETVPNSVDVAANLKEIKIVKPNAYRRNNSIVSEISAKTLQSVEGGEDSDEDGNEGAAHPQFIRHQTRSSVNSQSALGGRDSEDEQRQPSRSNLNNQNSQKAGGQHAQPDGRENGASQNTTTAPQHPKADMSPTRLELVGPTILRSLHCNWQLTKGFRKPKSETGFNYGSAITNGVENVGNSHLHYERLTVNTAREVFTRLLTKREDEKYISLKRAAANTYASEGDDEDNGSDSEPSADEKNPEELKTIHKRLLQKLKKRKDNFKSEPKNLVIEDDEPKEFRTVIAFGKTLRLPVVNGRLIRPDTISRPTTGKRGQPPLPPCETEKGSRPRSAPMVGRQAGTGVMGSTAKEKSEESPVDESNAENTATDSSQNRGGRDKRSGYGNRPPSGHDAVTAETAGMRFGPLAIASLVPSQLVPRSVRTGMQWPDGSPDLLQVAAMDDVPTMEPGVVLAKPRTVDESSVNRGPARMPAPTGTESMPTTHFDGNGSAVRHAFRSAPARSGGHSSEGGGRYASSDVRNFVEVKSIKPQSASRRTAEQLRRGHSGQSSVGTAFELPVASTANAPEKRWSANALHRIPLERSNGNTSAPRDNAPTAECIRGKGSPTVVGTQPQQRARIVGATNAPQKSGRSSPAPPINGKSRAQGSAVENDKSGDDAPRRRKSSDLEHDGRTVELTKPLGRSRAASTGSGPSQAQPLNAPIRQASNEFGETQVRSLYFPQELGESVGPGGPNSRRLSNGVSPELVQQPNVRKSLGAGWSCTGTAGLASSTVPGRAPSRSVHWAEEALSPCPITGATTSAESEAPPVWTNLAEKSTVEASNPVPLSSLLANSSLRPRPPAWMESRIRPLSEPPVGSTTISSVAENAALYAKVMENDTVESQPHPVELRSTAEMSQTVQASKTNVASRTARSQSGQPPGQRGNAVSVRAQGGQSLGQPPSRGQARQAYTLN